MKADLSFSAAKRLILESQEILRRAEQELVDASSVESRFEEEARQWQAWLTHVLHFLNAVLRCPCPVRNHRHRYHPTCPGFT